MGEAAAGHGEHAGARVVGGAGDGGQGHVGDRDRVAGGVGNVGRRRGSGGPVVGGRQVVAAAVAGAGAVAVEDLVDPAAVGGRQGEDELGGGGALHVGRVRQRVCRAAFAAEGEERCDDVGARCVGGNVVASDVQHAGGCVIGGRGDARGGGQDPGLNVAAGGLARGGRIDPGRGEGAVVQRRDDRSALVAVAVFVDLELLGVDGATGGVETASLDGCAAAVQAVRLPHDDEASAAEGRDPGGAHGRSLAVGLQDGGSGRARVAEGLGIDVAAIPLAPGHHEATAVEGGHGDAGAVVADGTPAHKGAADREVEAGPDVAVDAGGHHVTIGENGRDGGEARGYAGEVDDRAVRCAAVAEDGSLDRRVVAKVPGDAELAPVGARGDADGIVAVPPAGLIATAVDSIGFDQSVGRGAAGGAVDDLVTDVVGRGVTIDDGELAAGQRGDRRLSCRTARVDGDRCALGGSGAVEHAGIDAAVADIGPGDDEIAVAQGRDRRFGLVDRVAGKGVDGDVVPEIQIVGRTLDGEGVGLGDALAANGRAGHVGLQGIVEMHRDAGGLSFARQVGGGREYQMGGVARGRIEAEPEQSGDGLAVDGPVAAEGGAGIRRGEGGDVGAEGRVAHQQTAGIVAGDVGGGGVDTHLVAATVIEARVGGGGGVGGIQTGDGAEIDLAHAAAAGVEAHQRIGWREGAPVVRENCPRRPVVGAVFEVAGAARVDLVVAEILVRGQLEDGGRGAVGTDVEGVGGQAADLPARDDRRGGAPLPHVRIGEQAVILGELETAGLDVVNSGFEHPVTPETGGAGGVVGRGHVGAGGPRKGLDQIGSGRGGGDIAAVEQDVAVGLEGAADGAQGVLVCAEGVAVQGGGAQREGAAAAVSEDVDRVVVVVAGSPLGDLFKAVVRAIDQLDLDPLRDAAHEALIIDDLAVDEGHLAPPAVERRVHRADQGWTVGRAGLVRFAGRGRGLGRLGGKRLGGSGGFGGSGIVGVTVHRGDRSAVEHEALLQGQRPQRAAQGP